MFLVQSPLGARPDLGTQPRYEAPGNLRVENVKRSDKHQVSEAASTIMAESWLWGSQIAVKKRTKIKLLNLMMCFPYFEISAAL